ncbi:hypothetical protein ACVWXO_002754 [Bradyrhizobium sp. LM2.7]
MPGCGNGTLVMTWLRNQVDAALLGEVVHAGRIAAGVDRASHQRHRDRHEGITPRFRDRNRGDDGNGGLAHRHHMGVAAEDVQHLDDVVDVIVEIEAAIAERHHAGVGPVGDIDVMRRQEGFYRAAEQRRIMARHRRDDQHARLRAAQGTGELAIEVEQPAERFFPDRTDLDGNADAVDFGVVEAPFRLAVAARGALEQFAGRGDRFADLGPRPGIQGILKQELGRIGDGARRIERGLRHLVHPVHRRRQDRTAFCRQGRRAAELTNRHDHIPLRIAAYCRMRNIASMHGSIDLRAAHG